MVQPMICPICAKANQSSKVKIIGQTPQITPPWDYDEAGHIIEKAITVKIECDRGHKTDALLKGVLADHGPSGSDSDS